MDGLGRPGASDATGPPLIRVLRGHPDDLEVAALVAALLAVATASARGTGRSPRAVWSDPDRGVGGTARTGPDAWRLAGLPR